MASKIGDFLLGTFVFGVILFAAYFIITSIIDILIRSLL